MKWSRTSTLNWSPDLLPAACEFCPADRGGRQSPQAVRFGHPSHPSGRDPAGCYAWSGIVSGSACLSGMCCVLLMRLSGLGPHAQEEDVDV